MYAMIWDYLMDKLGNAYGAAGLMGNLFAESGLHADKLEYAHQKRLGYTSNTYTEAVDQGVYDNFVHDGAGYGLAQWTFRTRKEGLLSYARSRGTSIGDLAMQLDYLWVELNEEFPELLELLRTAPDLSTASDAVLTKFERPLDQGEAIKKQRTSYGQRYFNKYSGMIIWSIIRNDRLVERLNELSRWRTQISFLLEDYNTGTVYYERNAGVKRPIGSITKLMIAYLCAVRINEDERILAELVTIDRQAAEVSHDMGRSAYEQMEEGEQYTVEALMEMMLVASSCASTYALVKHILGSEETAVAQMNEAAARMRLSGHFVDIIGVSPYNECSARDLAILARRLIAEFPQIFTYTARREVLFRGDVYRSSSSLIRDDMMPGMDGLKSGTLLEAGMCYLGSAVYNGHRVISVVLNAQDKTERDAETAALLEYGLFRANEED